MLDKSTKTVLTLGYFDSIHLGHQKVIKSALELASKLDAKVTIVTFSGNLKHALNNENEKVVYTDSEREKLYYSLGVDNVFFAPATKEFLAMDSIEFLNFLNDKFNVVAYCTGSDYKFGNGANGNVLSIGEYADKKGQAQVVVDLVKDGATKISTTGVKALLINGDLEKANMLLARSYSVTGKVFSDRKVGRTLGFPTINIKVSNEQINLFEGVYKGHVYIDDKKYDALINYGRRPTFDMYERLIEAHILSFSGNLYDREVTVYFDKFLRKIYKFSSKEELIDRLNKDLEQVKERK
jgi:riboflavin kinase/FMN adenylyltransferase